MSASPTVGHGRRLSLVALGLLLALAVGLLWWALAHQVGEPPAPEGTGIASSTSTPQPPPDSLSDTTVPGAAGSTGKTVAPGRQAPAGRAPSSPSPSGSTPPSESTPQTTDAAPSAPVLPASDPVRVRMPAIDVDSPLHPLGLDDEGRLKVPSGELYDEAAWYSGSPTPGEPGPSVIEGHVTSQGSVPSVFFELGALRPGDTIEVDRDDGTTATFEVYGTDSFPKDGFPKATVYGNTSGPELRLITCGGNYDAERGAHVDNVVVFARLVDPRGTAG